MANEQKLQVNFPNELRGGVYANNMFVSHTHEEFIMDFITVVPPAGTVTARVITSPGHMKRIIAALQENMKRYEEKFGELRPADQPGKPLDFEGGYL